MILLVIFRQLHLLSHEIVHYMTASFMGYSVISMDVNAFFGQVVVDNVHKRTDFIIISLSGVVFSILYFFIIGFRREIFLVISYGDVVSLLYPSVNLVVYQEVFILTVMLQRLFSIIIFIAILMMVLRSLWNLSPPIDWQDDGSSCRDVTCTYIGKPRTWAWRRNYMPCWR